MAKSRMSFIIVRSLGSLSQLGGTALICLAAYFIHLCVQRYMKYKADVAFGRKNGCQEPPELPNHWPFGVDRIKELWNANADGRLLAFITSVARDYEPRNNLSQFLLLGPRAFHILHPKNVEALLSADFKSYGFGCRPSVFAPLLGNGIFTQEGHEWKHSRELLRKQFARLQYQKLDQFDDHVNNLINCIPAEGDIDLQPLFFKLTMDVATALLFGRSIYSLRASLDQDAENRQFDKSFNLAQEGLAKRFRLAPLHFFYNPRSFQIACRDVHSFVERYIEERAGKNLASQEGAPSWFIDQITKESKSRTEIRDQLINTLLAGRDTTACCLTWTFRLLVRHICVMGRLRQEVVSVMKNSTTPTREQIRQMPFLSCVVKEIPLNNREATRTTTLPTGGGPTGNSPMLVRKGEVVVFSQYVNSRKKNLFGPDAEHFRPERWETGELDNIGWAYFPFNGGPRQCLGEDFALMEVYYTVVSLLQTFPVIKLPDGEQIEPVGTERQRLTLVLSSADGCRVTVARS